MRKRIELPPRVVQKKTLFQRKMQIFSFRLDFFPFMFRATKCVISWRQNALKWTYM